MPNSDSHFYPIIFVRGYAMCEDEINETTADPFCGFNIGSTVYRAAAEKDRPPKKFIFESPLVRMLSDFGYKDVYEDGCDIVDPSWTSGIPRKSIIIYRYYDDSSTLLGSGKPPKIEEFASGLSDLILKTRHLVCLEDENNITETDFRCYLVAHSMGGLVCRAFLQNTDLGVDAARQCVAKVFTYATPHNGIEMGGFNVPKWLSKNDINNFNRERMSEYLAVKKLYNETQRVDWLPESVFNPDNFFCMIGTNRGDYEVAKGASRMFCGQGSDGLVRIANASVWGVDDSGNMTKPCPRAYTYRSHSGYFGIVNSEEAYQNLTRFLFGDVRIDLWLDIKSINFPLHIQDALNSGKKINAIFQVETLASPRGKPWYLTRRISEEDSVSCLDVNDYFEKPESRSLYLSSVFLGNRWKVVPGRNTWAYGLTVGIKVPDYEINNALWLDDHYEGSYLFHDSLIFEISHNDNDLLTGISYKSRSGGFENSTSDITDKKLIDVGKMELFINFNSNSTPGASGTLRALISTWND